MQGRVQRQAARSKTTSKVTVASGSYSIAAGKSATVRLKLSSKGRSLMRKVTKVRVKLTASPKSGKAASKTLTLRG